MRAENRAIEQPSMLWGSSISRIEFTLLLVLFLLGIGMRGWHLSSVALDHYDEGVYALSALGLTDPDQPHRLYPDQIKFSPPVYLLLTGLSYYLLGGPSDIAAIAVNVLLGALTIVAIWWLGRLWFDAATGIGTAALLTFSEFHIALSLTALTDVAFALFFLVALALVTVAIHHQNLRLSLLAGLAIGVAWNTKYHGWFALLIAGMALLPYLWFNPTVWFNRIRGRLQLRPFFLYGVMGAVAVACYLPWALFVQSRPGGYLALAAYQRTLIDGHWWTNLKRQVQLQHFLDGSLGSFSVFVAIFCVVLLVQPRLRLTWRLLIALGILIATTLWLGGVGTAALFTIFMMPIVLCRPRRLGTWLILSWLALWFFATPLYHPYARLVLPFTLATYLGAALLLSVVIAEMRRDREFISWHPLSVTGGVAALVIVGLLLIQVSNPGQPSRTLPTAVNAMSKLVPPGSRVIVVGEPALAFYLHLANRPAFERVEDPSVWATLPTPVYIAAGVYANRAPVLREGLEKLGDRLILLGTYPMIPKDIRLLDDFSPTEARLFRANPDKSYEIKLYRLQPISTAGVSN